MLQRALRWLQGSLTSGNGNCERLNVPSSRDQISAAPPSAEQFRTALRALVGQVSVITLGVETGGAMGLTLTSANALSTEPALLIAAINRMSSAHSALRLGGIIGWQVLGAAHQGVAERFSGKGGLQGPARFEGADWHDDHGARVLVGAPLACACEVESLSNHGSHTVVIARLLSLYSTPSAGTLAYRDGAYLPLP